jgi:hypothetical protein
MILMPILPEAGILARANEGLCPTSRYSQAIKIGEVSSVTSMANIKT